MGSNEKTHSRLFVNAGFIWGWPDPDADAILVRNGWICAVGKAAELKHVARELEVIDLSGNSVLPGFNDAHVHLFEGGKSLTEIDLRLAQSLEEFQARIRDFAQRILEGRWITGGHWDHRNWGEQRLPTRHDIDAVCSKNPVLLYRKDGHIAVANSLALDLAGIGAGTAEVAGGTIDRDERGQPTGILRDEAIKLVEKVIPEPDEEDLRRYLEAAQEHAVSVGVTSVQGPVTPRELGVLQEYRNSGRLKLRVNGWFGTEHFPLLEQMEVRVGFGDPWLRIGTVKVFSDGSLGAGTAYFKQAYEDQPGYRGLLIYTEEELERVLRRAHDRGLQLAVHAIGDAAVSLVLDIFEKLGDVRSVRHRVEHAQTVADEDVARLARLGAAVSVQPAHLLSDLPWASEKIGDRVRQSYRLRSWVNAGAPVALGTDWPVEPLTPFRTLSAALFRCGDGFEQGRPVPDPPPDETVDVSTAIAAYTTGSAYAEHQEHCKGALAPGYLADFIVLNRDLRTVREPEELTEVRVLLTVVGGRIAYART